MAPGSLATRAAAVPFMLGDASAALGLLDRCSDPGEDVDASEAVEWLALRAHCLAVLGRGADESAERALRRAEADGAPRALLAAHVAMARVSAGARKEAHLDRAAGLALATGDLLTLARVRTNQGYLMLASARYAAAVEPARQAVAACQAVSPPGMLCAACTTSPRPWPARATSRKPLGSSGARWCSAAGSDPVGPRSGCSGPHRSSTSWAGPSRRAATGMPQTWPVVPAELQVLVPALCGLARLDADAASLTRPCGPPPRLPARGRSWRRRRSPAPAVTPTRLGGWRARPLSPHRNPGLSTSSPSPSRSRPWLGRTRSWPGRS